MNEAKDAGRRGRPASPIWVKRMREAAGIPRKRLARMCGCSETLILIAEAGRAVHPLFATRIARELGATAKQAEALMAPPARARWRAGVKLGDDNQKWEKGTFHVAKRKARPRAPGR